MNTITRPSDIIDLMTWLGKIAPTTKWTGLDWQRREEAPGWVDFVVQISPQKAKALLRQHSWRETLPGEGRTTTLLKDAKPHRFRELVLGNEAGQYYLATI